MIYMISMFTIIKTDNFNYGFPLLQKICYEFPKNTCKPRKKKISSLLLEKRKFSRCEFAIAIFAWRVIWNYACIVLNLAFVADIVAPEGKEENEKIRWKEARKRVEIGIKSNFC